MAGADPVLFRGCIRKFRFYFSYAAKPLGELGGRGTVLFTFEEPRWVYALFYIITNTRYK